MNKKHCIPLTQNGNKRTGSGKRHAKNRNQVGLVGHVGIAAEEKSQSTYTPTHTLSNNTKQREEPKIKKTNKTHREYVRGGLKTPSCIKRLLYTLRRLLLLCWFAEEDSQRTLRGLSRYTCVVRTARRCAWPPRQHHGARTHRARPPAPSPQTSIMPLSAGWAFTIPLH